MILELLNDILTWFLSIESTFTKVTTAFISLASILIIIYKTYKYIFKKQSLKITLSSNTYDPDVILFEAENCSDSTISLNKEIYVDTINPVHKDKFLRFLKLNGNAKRFVFVISTIDRTLTPYTPKLFEATNKTEDINALAGGYLWTTFRKYIFTPTKGSKKIIFTDTVTKTFREAGTGTIKPISRLKFFAKKVKFRLFGRLRFGNE